MKPVFKEEEEEKIEEYITPGKLTSLKQLEEFLRKNKKVKL